MSAYSVKKACYRHFEEWNDRRGNHYRTVYSDYQNMEVAFITTESKQGAVDLERELILEYVPRDNRDKFKDHRITKEQDYGDYEPKDDCPF